MSKIAIILCIVVFASAANASHWSGALATAQKRTDDLLDITTNEVKSKLQTTKETATEISEKLQAAALDYSKKMFTDISMISKQAHEQGESLTRSANGVDVTECTQSIKQLDLMALATLSNVSSCIVDKLESAAGYSESMIKISNDVMHDFDETRTKMHHCADNVDGILSGGKAVICTNSISANFTLTAVKEVPLVTKNLANLVSSLASLQPSLLNCSVSGGLVDYNLESSRIMKKTEECVQRKIDDARNNSSNGDPKTTKFHDDSTTVPHDFTDGVINSSGNKHDTMDTSATTKDFQNQPTQVIPTTEANVD